jgi:hypothetical protein
VAPAAPFADDGAGLFRQVICVTRHAKTERLAKVPRAATDPASATPAVADAARELVRCELEAKHLYPAPNNKGFENWPERQANLRKRAENTETCMRAAGYSVTAECSAPLKTKLYEDR